MANKTKLNSDYVIDGNKINWTGELVRETSYHRENLGTFQNEMEFGFTQGNKNHGYIEWCFGRNTLDEDVVEIGLVFENKELTDYDGVFELPEPAILLLESLGFDCTWGKG